MKYNCLQACMLIAEEICRRNEYSIENANVSLLNFQKTVNAPVEQKVRVEINDYVDFDIVLEFIPKGGIEE